MSKSATLAVDTVADATSPAIAALPMYDLPELESATDSFWHAIAARLKDSGVSVPDSLTRIDDYHAAWHNPALLLGQTCGYPLVTQLKSAVQIVATPIYGAPGCQGFEHRSFFIVNAGSEHRTLPDLRGGVCAINGFDSNTGTNLLRAAIAPLANGSQFFRSITITGSHRKSLEAVASGDADIAAIDCVSFAHFQRFDPDIAARVSKIGESLSTATPPYITAAKTDPGILRVLREAFRDIAIASEVQPVRSALNIEGFAFETDGEYERFLLIERQAAALGYAELR